MSTQIDETGFGVMPQYTDDLAADAYNYLEDHDETQGISLDEFAGTLQDILEDADSDSEVSIGDLTYLLERGFPEIDGVYLERIAIELLRS